MPQCMQAIWVDGCCAVDQCLPRSYENMHNMQACTASSKLPASR